MSRRRRRLPAIEMTVAIEGLTNESRGVAHYDGKAVFVGPSMATVISIAGRRLLRLDINLLSLWFKIKEKWIQCLLAFSKKPRRAASKDHRSIL